MSEHNHRRDDQTFHKIMKVVPLLVLFGSIIATWTALGFDNETNKTAITKNETAIEDTKEKLSIVKETVIRIEVRQEQLLQQQQEMKGDLKNILFAINQRNSAGNHSQ